MPSISSQTDFNGRIALHTVIALVVTALLAVLAGCSGVSAPGVDAAENATSTTSPDPPLADSDAERQAEAAEKQYIRENKIPGGTDSWGWGGLATTKAIAAAPTDDGWFVRVRVGFWHNTNTDEGELHADGVSRTAYYVTPNATTRVSVPGHEMKGSSVDDGAEELELRVVNTADSAQGVSLSVHRVDADAVYERDAVVAARSAAHSPPLPVSDGEYEVVATIGEQTARIPVTVDTGEESPVEVTVFVAPDGSMTIARTPGHL